MRTAMEEFLDENQTNMLILIGATAVLAICYFGFMRTHNEAERTISASRCEAMDGIPIIVKGRPLCLSKKMLLEVPQ